MLAYTAGPSETFSHKGIEGDSKLQRNAENPTGNE